MAELTYVEQRDNELQEDFRLRVANQLDYDPDLARRILDIKGKTGLPDEVIAADIDDIEKQVRINAFDPERYRKKSPKWAKFASENPYHLAVLQEDFESLSTWERMWKPAGLAWDSSWAMVERAEIAERRMANDGVYVEGDEERYKELQKWEQPHDFGVSLGGLETTLTAPITYMNKQLGNMIYVSAKGAEYSTYMAPVGAGIGASIGVWFEGLGAVPGAIAGYGIGRTYGFYTGMWEGSRMLEGSHAYAEYRELGMDHESSLVAAKIVGGVAGSLEAVSQRFMLSKIPGVRNITKRITNELVKDIVTKPTMTRAIGKAVGIWGQALGLEITTEVLQEATTVAGGEILKRYNDKGAPMEWAEFSDRISEIAVETFKSTLLLTGFGPGAQIYVDSRRASHAKQMEYAYKALGDASKNSKTRKKLKGKYLEFVDRVTADGPVDSILLDKDRFIEYFQEVGEDPNQMADKLGIDMEHAEATGRIEIPVDKYAEHIAPTEHNNALAPDLKTDDAQMTAREADHFEKNKPEIIREIEEQIGVLDKAIEAAEASEQQVVAEVMGEIIAQGFDPTAARHQATIMRGLVNLARRASKEELELFERHWGGIKRALPKALQKKEDIDIVVDPLLDAIKAGELPTETDIFGQSLIQFLKDKGGLQDEGGELSARDVWKEQAFLVRKGGLSIDAAAELAAEAGYISEGDETQFMEALDRELKGQRVFGRDADPMLASRARMLEELSDFIETEGIDLSLSNAEIRALLKAGQTFEQTDFEKFTELTTIALQSADFDPALMTQIEQMIPRISETQDFSAVQFTDTMQVEGTTEMVEVTQDAQRIFDRAVKRRNVVKKLQDCVSG